LIIAFADTLLDAVCAAALGGAGQPRLPFTTPTGAEAGKSNSDWAGFGLGVAAAVTQSMWGLVDVALEEFAYDSGQPSKSDLIVLDLLTVLDVLFPILILIFQWPVPPSYTGTQTPAPFHYKDFSDGHEWGDWYRL